MQIKLDKLLQTKEKKQAGYEKTKQELSAISKNIDSTKLKLFEILQSGSDDAAFSNWAKRKINESDNNEKNENGNSEKPEKTITQNNQNQTKQILQIPAQQNQIQ